MSGEVCIQGCRGPPERRCAYGRAQPAPGIPKTWLTALSPIPAFPPSPKSQLPAPPASSRGRSEPPRRCPPPGACGRCRTGEGAGTATAPPGVLGDFGGLQIGRVNRRQRLQPGLFKTCGFHLLPHKHAGCLMLQHFGGGERGWEGRGLPWCKSPHSPPVLSLTPSPWTGPPCATRGGGSAREPSRRGYFKHPPGTAGTGRGGPAPRRLPGSSRGQGAPRLLPSGRGRGSHVGESGPAAPGPAPQEPPGSPPAAFCPSRLRDLVLFCARFCEIPRGSR